MEEYKVPDNVPSEVVVDVEKKTERQSWVTPRRAIEDIDREKQNILEAKGSPERKISATTYLDICRMFIKLPLEQRRISQLPDNKFKKNQLARLGVEAADMNQNLMFVIRCLRERSPELLKDVHGTFRNLCQIYPESRTLLEDYDNWVGGVFMELATIEALQDLNTRFKMNGTIIKSCPEDDAGMNEEKQKIDFFIKTSDGEALPFQLKTNSGTNEDWIEVDRSKTPYLVSVFCRKREDLVNLINGRFSDKFRTLLASKFLNTEKEVTWQK
jgi:hypothetical protein